MVKREITEAQFRTYEKVRRSGQTNMMDWQRVQSLSWRYGVFLDRKDILEIIQNYEELKPKFQPEEINPIEKQDLQTI